jgi:hypothetical protein
MMIRYVFSDDEPLRIKAAHMADPQKIGEALEQIRLEHGVLKPQAVVEAAQDLASPLHPHFEWDDRAAAHRYRLDQARTLIRVIRVEDDSAGEPPRAFYTVTTRDGQAYHSLEEVRTSADLQRAVQERALRDLEGFLQRYNEISEVCEIVRVAKMKLEEMTNGRRPPVGNDSRPSA